MAVHLGRARGELRHERGVRRRLLRRDHDAGRAWPAEVASAPRPLLFRCCLFLRMSRITNETNKQGVADGDGLCRPRLRRTLVEAVHDARPRRLRAEPAPTLRRRQYYTPCLSYLSTVSVTGYNTNDPSL
jgi:hypothetical protein